MEQPWRSPPWWNVCRAVAESYHLTPLFYLVLDLLFWHIDLYEDWHSGAICPFMFPEPTGDGVPFLSRSFGFLPLHFRPCAMC